MVPQETTAIDVYPIVPSSVSIEIHMWSLEGLFGAALHPCMTHPSSSDTRKDSTVI